LKINFKRIMCRIAIIHAVFLHCLGDDHDLL
jgi:hypothetical protein